MRASLLLIALAAPALSACASTPGPGDSGYAYNVSGSYQGRFMFDGQPFDTRLDLRTAGGGRVQGDFTVTTPVKLNGAVEGVVLDELLRLTVTYTNPEGCDGRIEGVLTVEAGGGVFDGPVSVTDCGQPVSGRMSFRRVDPGTLSDASALPIFVE
jgi:hypothetical protein